MFLSLMKIHCLMDVFVPEIGLLCVIVCPRPVHAVPTWL